MIRLEPATLPWMEALAEGDDAFASGSTVLGRCGFRRAGEVADPDEGVTWRWEVRAGVSRACAG